MTRKEISNEIVARVQERVGDNFEVGVREVAKNNGVKLTALNIAEKGSGVIPNIYIDTDIEMISRNDAELDDVVESILDMWRQTENDRCELSAVTKEFSREEILENVIKVLSNKEMNKEKLDLIPHKELLDLVVTYRFIIRVDEEGFGTAEITNQVMKNYGITQEELENAAEVNTEKFQNFKIRTMREILFGMDEDMAEMMLGEENNPMFVARGDLDLYGAVVMTYPKYFAGLAEKLDSDLMILPSSIHEVIAIPLGVISKDGASEMVGEVNEAEVRDEEFLSNNVYRYNRETGAIELL